MNNQRIHQTFSENLHARFQIQSDARAVELKLVEVSPFKRTSLQEQFALIFCGASDAFLPQGTYTLHSESAGSFDLFLVPIRQDAGGFYYEAVFNNLRDDSGSGPG